MTIDELNKLTDDEMRVRVAERMGWGFEWRDVDNENKNATIRRPGGWLVGKFYVDVLPPCLISELPNYPADLNAMHEAEKTLTDSSQRIRYQNALYDLGPKDPAVSGWHWTTADARARAIAFLAVTDQPTKGR